MIVWKEWNYESRRYEPGSISTPSTRWRRRRRQTQNNVGDQLGPLHGIPVAIKDIFDTNDFPTEWGSSLLKGRRPDADAAAVARLREAGAIILGKTVTTEFASFAPGPTCNPHDLSRTPGGSSSGSAAAVADCMVPLALGSQTAGSTIRPGSFCGIVALKPQFGAISRHGCMMMSATLDHFGLYARTVSDIALLAEALYAEDPRDATSGSVNAKELSAALDAHADPKPRLGFVPTPFWTRMDKGARQAFEGFVDGLGDVERVELPAEFSHAPGHVNIICDAEVAHLLPSFTGKGRTSSVTSSGPSSSTAGKSWRLLISTPSRRKTSSARLSMRSWMPSMPW